MTADAVMAPESAEAARKAITVAISMAENAADLAHDLAAQAWFICVAGGLLGWAATVAISDLAHIEECRSLVAASAWIYMLAMVAAGVGVTVVYIAFRGAAIARRMLRRTCHLEKLYHSNDVCRDYNVFHRVRARMIKDIAEMKTFRPAMVVGWLAVRSAAMFLLIGTGVMAYILSSC